MNKLENALKKNKQIRVIGFDDAPFNKDKGGVVNITGVVCSNTKFEGMLWGQATKDGRDATEAISKMMLNSKFHEQAHLVLIDGIAIGGFNVVDLKELSVVLKVPCVAVMRRMPDMVAIENALENLEDGEEKLALIRKAGAINQINDFVFQVHGADENLVASALGKLTDQGLVPEALRLAHLIGSAVMTGESSSRA